MSSSIPKLDGDEIDVLVSRYLQSDPAVQEFVDSDRLQSAFRHQPQTVYESVNCKLHEIATRLPGLPAHLQQNELSAVFKGLRLLRANLPSSSPSPKLAKQLQEVLQEIADNLDSGKKLKSAADTPTAGRDAFLKYLKMVKDMLHKYQSQSTEDVRFEMEPNAQPISKQACIVKVEFPQERFSVSILSLRKRLPSSPKKKMPSLLLRCNIFGGHVAVLQGVGAIDKYDSVKKCTENLEIDYSACVGAPEMPSSRLLKSVIELKQQENMVERKIHSHTSAITRFEYYANQTMMNISENLLHEIVETVVAGPKKSRSAQEYCAASQLLIKVLMDQYVSGDLLAIQSMMTVFLEMLDSNDPDTMVHAYDLLLNLSIHAHFIEDNGIKFEETEITGKPAGSAPDQSESMPNPLGNIRSDVVLADLFEKLRVMLLWTVQRRTRFNRVWKSALNCLLMHTVADGIPDRQKLSLVDPRVYCCFLRYAGILSDSVESLVIAMLVHRLYNDQQCLHLDRRILEQIGGLDFILKLYAVTSSPRVREDLFTVLFDVTLQNLTGSFEHEPSDHQLGLMMDLFRAMDLPQYLPFVLRQMPKQFAERLTIFVDSVALNQSQEWIFPFKSLEKAVFVVFLAEMERSILRFHQLDKDLEFRFKLDCKTVSMASPSCTLLNMLLRGDAEEQRKWFDAILKFMSSPEFKSRSREEVDEFQKNVGRILSGLLTSKNPMVRRQYLIMSDRLLLDKFYKLWEYRDDDQAMAEFINIISSYIMPVVKSGEQFYANLLFIYDIITRFVFVPAAERTSYDDPIIYYSNSDAFLKGRRLIQLSVLKHISPTILRYLFTRLSSKHHGTERACLLIMMIEQSRHNSKCLEQIGGLEFLKKVVVRVDDPLIAHLTSQFLVQLLSEEKPHQYQQLVRKLATRLGISESELVENAYLQIRSVLDLSMQKS